jgi:hypothetical protein
VKAVLSGGNMSLMDEANKMLNGTNIMDYASKPLLRPTIRVTAADLLTELAAVKGFKPTDSTCDYMGSVDNQTVVKQAIAERWGTDEVARYQPTVNVKPKTTWLQEHYVVKDGEMPLCFIHTWRHGEQYVVALFHEKQVELAL